MSKPLGPCSFPIGLNIVDVDVFLDFWISSSNKSLEVELEFDLHSLEFENILLIVDFFFLF